MEEQLKQIFKSRALLEPSQALRGRILNRINRYEIAKTFRLKLAYFAAAVFAALAIVPTIEMLAQSISQSGLYQFISLLFSDADIVASQWQSFSLSILEAIPITELALSLSLLCLIIWAINKIPSDKNLLQIKTA